MQSTLQERKREVAPAGATPPDALQAWRKLPLRPEEGWSTLILLGFVLYSAVWSIQAVNWVDGLGVLTWTTGIGLVLGLVAAKQRRLSRFLIHWLTVGAGVLFAFWQTSTVSSGGNIGVLWNHFATWLNKAFTPNADTNDDLMFLLFLAVLSFILAYVSVWLVFHTRRPWLVAIATAIVLLINLAYTPDNKGLIYLVIFLMATLLLLVRSNLTESYRQWRRRSLRYTPDLGWDFMLAGLIFSIGILIFSWFLPSGGVNPTAAAIWNGASNPWVSIQQFWTRLFQVRGGPGSLAYFGNRVQLTGNVDLPNITILTYTTDGSDQYLVAETQDSFDGHGWDSTGGTTRSYSANQHMAPDSDSYQTVKQDIKLVNPPQGNPNQYYVFAAEQPGWFTLPASATRDEGGFTSWYSRDPLVPGQHYTAYSYVSAATEDQLRQVPLPGESLGDPNYERYTKIPSDLQNDPRVRDLARKVTSGASNMYDKALALESYLRDNYTYSAHNDDPPSDQDGVSWFLFTEHHGFCTFFASAMVMMARLLGMPARFASGYTTGQYDQKQGEWVVKGTDAHSWAQIYFAGYGWINFEPSASFTTFNRPLPSATATGSTTPTGGTVTPRPSKSPKDPNGQDATGGTSPTGTLQNDLGMRLLLGTGGSLAVILLLVGSSSIWWRRRFRGLSPVAQTFGRVTLLASWAGFAPKRAQTPFEYIEELQQRLPTQAEPLQRLGDLYVRERWGAPGEGSGILQELRQLWSRLRGTLVRAVVRRPPLNPLAWVRALATRRRRRQK